MNKKKTKNNNISHNSNLDVLALLTSNFENNGTYSLFSSFFIYLYAQVGLFLTHMHRFLSSFYLSLFLLSCASSFNSNTVLLCLFFITHAASPARDTTSLKRGS